MPESTAGVVTAALKGGPWLVSFATYRRRQVFENPAPLAACGAALEEASARNGYAVYALAIMPDHVHVVLAAGTSGRTIAKVVNNLKGVPARRVFQAAPELKLDLRSEHLWADEYDARLLPNQAAVRRACTYIRQNPVALGLPPQQFAWIPGPSFRAAAKPTASPSAAAGLEIRPRAPADGTRS